MPAPTLTGRIRESAVADRGVTFLSAAGEPVRRSWAEMYQQATSVAADLQARGIGPGSHVALLGPTTPALVVAIEAVWLCGATLVVLPLPLRLGSIDEFVGQTAARVRHADASLVLIDPDFAPFVPTEGLPPVVRLDELVTDRPERFAVVDPAVDSLAVLQFTSGSTADPKGVMLPHRTVCANLDAIAAAADLVPGADVMVSWLPLYHDMGLVGFLMLPMSRGVDLALAAPQDFLGDPARWMRWISDHRGTATAGPNFAWVLATRALRRSAAKGERLDLSALRIALNGAEPVDPDAVQRFIDAAAEHGMRPEAVFPAFGMAELVIGGTFPEPLAGLQVDVVDRARLERERVAVPVAADTADARRLAFLGRAVPGLELRIVDTETGEVLPDRRAGELQIRGTSVTPGYYRHPAHESTLFDGDWLNTGDLAYLVDGRLVMCGRLKDMIIIGGRNIFPEDVERAVGGLDGVRAGNVVAFGVDHQRGKEALVVVAESTADDPVLTRKLVVERALEVIGVPPRDVVLVRPGSLPKTSSGKLQRSLCRARYAAGELVGTA